MSDDPDGFPSRPALVPDDVRLEYIAAFWHSLAWQETPWLGHAVPKAPADLIAYQELIVRLRPDWIVETRAGAATVARFMANICDLVDRGRVLTVGSIEPARGEIAHSRITSLTAAPTHPPAIEAVTETVGAPANALVILGSRAPAAQTLEEFKAYSGLVPIGGYIVVEDTIVGGKPVWPGFGPGPGHALRTVLSTREDFQADASLERWGPTFNPGGYMKRISS